VRFCLLAVTLAWTGLAETPQEAAMAKQRAAVEAMRAPLTVQQESVQKQIRGVKGNDFYTVPWVNERLLATPVSYRITSPACTTVDRSRLEPAAEQAARRNDLPPALLRAVIGRESAWDPCAVSSAGAMGLMQLMPGTAAGLGVDDPFDPFDNIDAGTRYLKTLLDRYGGDLAKALAGYNAGPGRVDEAGGIPPIKETRDYVREILRQIQ
jgi:soluble lytic murein transglycosylase-like protein